MGFWIFMSLCCCIIPVMMLVFGILFYKHPPKSRNGAIGYRTSRAYKSQQTWDFAQKYFAKIWKKVGMVMLPVTVISCLWALGLNESQLGMFCLVLTTAQCVVLIGSIYPVERALKKNFDEKGRSLTGDDGKEMKVDAKKETEEIKKIEMQSKKLERAVWIFVGIVTIFTIVFLTTGDIKTTFNEQDIRIESSYWSDMTISYDEIQSVELQKDWNVGYRTFGLGSFKLEAGNFKNEQAGDYTLYSYIHCKTYILIETEDELIVLNAKNEAETEQLYEELLGKVKK